MSDSLLRHIQYLSAADPFFAVDWQARGRRCAPVLARIDSSASLLHDRILWPHLQDAAVRGAAQVCGHIPDFDCLVTPRPNIWIARCLPLPALRLFHPWRYYIGRSLRNAPAAARAWYGGLKSQKGISQRIMQGLRGADFDLWDGVRFRLVVDTIREAEAIVQLLFDEFRRQIVRCRNYYIRPRHGPTAQYRAIHLELQSDSEDFIEVQVVSVRREAIGLIDHPLILKRRVPFLSPVHRAWLESLSSTANLLDCLDYNVVPARAI